MNDQRMHISEKELGAYIRNEVTEHQRERIELEIQLCEQCLAKYISLLDQQSPEQLPEPLEMAERVVDQIRQQAVKAKPRWIQRPVVQYGIAASITLLLITSGLMSTVSHTLIKLDQTVEIQKVDHPLIPESSAETQSQKWLDKASRWIEAVQDRRFEK